MTDIIEKELAYRINGCIFDVHNEVGPGLREECYQKAMELRLAQARLTFRMKPHTRSELVYLGKVAGVFEPDLIVADCIIVELKALAEGLPVSAFRQTINYLKFFRCELGLLVNFADSDAVIRRIVYHNEPALVHEDFDAVRGEIATQVREQLIIVREVILSIHSEFGLGYSDHIYRRLLEIGLDHRGLGCQTEVVAQPVFRERLLPNSPITPLLVDDSILIQVEAIQDGVTARAMRTMQTHLRCLNAAVGVIVSFGQHRFEIRGVRPRRE